MRIVSVGIGEIRVVERPDRLVTYGLGSCVAIVIFCPPLGVGAMAHVMLPMAFDPTEALAPGKYADTAVQSMAETMTLRGAKSRDLFAKIAGGADMFAEVHQGRSRRIGARNILSARKTLTNFGIALMAEDVGGTVGRTAEFDTVNGGLVVRTLYKDIKVL